MKRLLAVLLLLAVAAPVFAADVYVKVRTRTDAISLMGQTEPAKDEISEQWFTATKAAQVGAGRTVIIDLDRSLVIIAIHGSKTYVETPLPMDITKILPPAAAAMASMFQVTATVKETTETKTVGTWPCLGYDSVVTMMGMPVNMRIWASTALPGNLGTFVAKFLPTFLQGQMQMSADSAAQFAKIKGYPIATELSGDILGAKLHTTTDVIEISEKPAPAGVYAPPAGYTKKATLEADDLRK